MKPYKLLLLDHWQLFIYLFFIPGIQIFHIIYKINSWTNMDTIIEMSLLNIFMIVFGVWFFTLCNRMDVGSIKPKVSKVLAYNFVVLVLYSLAINYINFDYHLSETVSEEYQNFYDSLLPIMGIAQVYSTTLYLITVYLLAKAFLRMENRDHSGILDTIKLGLLILVTPLGIWNFQPRIQRIFADLRN